MKINIIGAGPVGCYLAYLLADKFEVEVYEEHAEIGKPVQCAGIITNSINSVIQIPPEVILNKIKNFEISYKDQKLKIKLRNPDIIIDRTKFDTFFYNKAKERGVKFSLGKRINDLAELKGIIIGADGPNSIVSKAIGNKTTSWMGIQTKIKLPDSQIKASLDYGKFGWTIPEGNGTCRVGIMDEKENAKQTFKKFTKGKQNSLQAGLIPKYNPKNKLCKNNLYIVGDAAGMVKATTGGGIIPGLKAAKVLANCLIKRKKYKRKLRKVRKELKTQLIARKVLDHLNDEEIKKLFKLNRKEKNKKILEEIDRDNLKKIAIKLLLRNPTLITYAPKIYK